MSPSTSAARGACILVLALPLPAAHWVNPTPVPVERLADNITGHLLDHPGDANAHYVLGRVHYLAFVHACAEVAVYDGGTAVPRLPRAELQKSPRGGWRGPVPEELRLEEGARRRHLRSAVESHRRALALDPDEALYALGLASALADGAELAADVALDPPLDPSADLLPAADATAPGDDGDAPAESAEPAASSVWRAAAAEHFARAFDRAIVPDEELEHLPLAGLHELVSHEAATGYLALAEHLPLRERRAARVAEMEAALERLAELRPIGVTPIVFALEPRAGLDALLDPDGHVAFDLDGTGRPQTWSWVRPDTALLVWDPAGEGAITSGRQLLGAVTWWMFWRDGYAALAALDDDRDGRLAGAELEGLAAWFDRDGDGVSSPDEVLPLSALGIASLATAATATERGMPTNPRGLTFGDGRALPTWDWIATPRSGWRNRSVSRNSTGPCGRERWRVERTRADATSPSCGRCSRGTRPRSGASSSGCGAYPASSRR